MEEYQERVVSEVKELDIKIQKLSEFLSSGNQLLKVEEHVRMQKQLSVMLMYSAILKERILNFQED